MWWCMWQSVDDEKSWGLAKNAWNARGEMRLEKEECARQRVVLARKSWNEESGSIELRCGCWLEWAERKSGTSDEIPAIVRGTKKRAKLDSQPESFGSHRRCSGDIRHREPCVSACGIEPQSEQRSNRRSRGLQLGSPMRNLGNDTMNKQRDSIVRRGITLSTKLFMRVPMSKDSALVLACSMLQEVIKHHG